MPVLLRPDGAVQVGWDPRRAVLVRPPRGLTATGLAALLRSMRSPIPITELQRQAAERGLVDGDAMANLVAQLVGAGVATPLANPGNLDSRVAPRPSGSTVAGRCQTCSSRRCAAPVPGSGTAANHMRR